MGPINVLVYSGNWPIKQTEEKLRIVRLIIDPFYQ